MRPIGKSPVDQLKRAARETSPDRERHVDLIRAVAIAAVVLGHWLVIAVTETNGRLDGINALKELTWAHPLTWLFQVMPLFFLIGGYANAASLEAHYREGGNALGWVVGRYDRLLRPTTVLLGVLVAAVVAARLVGVDHNVAADAAWLATLPMWFLLIYLAIVVLVPVAHAAHRRFGLAVPAALVGIVALGDLARLGLELPGVGKVNYLVAWLAVHQVGFAWRDGRLRARAEGGLPLAAAGFALLVVLTTLGPYPVSMVGVPGEDVQNTGPPTLALMALATVQVGVALSLRDRARRWLDRDRPWTVVIGVNSVILTVFLWHMAAAIAAAVALYGTGLMPTAAVGSATWVALRVPWLMVCGLVLAVLVALCSRVELGMPSARKGAVISGRWASVAVFAGVGGSVAGMLGVTVAGGRGPLGLPTEALAAYAAGVVLLALVERRAGLAGRG